MEIVCEPFKKGITLYFWRGRHYWNHHYKNRVSLGGVSIAYNIEFKKAIILDNIFPDRYDSDISDKSDILDNYIENKVINIPIF